MKLSVCYSIFLYSLGRKLEGFKREMTKKKKRNSKKKERRKKKRRKTRKKKMMMIMAKKRERKAGPICVLKLGFANVVGWRREVT